MLLLPAAMAIMLDSRLEPVLVRWTPVSPNAVSGPLSGKGPRRRQTVKLDPFRVVNQPDEQHSYGTERFVGPRLKLNWLVTASASKLVATNQSPPGSGVAATCEEEAPASGYPITGNFCYSRSVNHPASARDEPP